jgi:hypothetical protein
VSQRGGVLILVAVGINFTEHVEHSIRFFQARIDVF